MTRKRPSWVKRGRYGVFSQQALGEPYSSEERLIGPYPQRFEGWTALAALTGMLFFLTVVVTWDTIFRESPNDVSFYIAAMTANVYFAMNCSIAVIAWFLVEFESTRKLAKIICWTSLWQPIERLSRLLARF